MTSTNESQRLVSLDAHRGFIMFALVTYLFFLSVVPQIIGTDNWLGKFLEYQTSHVVWAGCAAWDLVQPSFMFIVGVSLPYAYAARKKKGESEARILAHTIKRIVLLLVIGFALRSQGRDYIYFTLEDVVQQIALGYFFLYLMIGRTVRTQFAVAGAVLLGYYMLFALWAASSGRFQCGSRRITRKLAALLRLCSPLEPGCQPCWVFRQLVSEPTAAWQRPLGVR